MPPKVESFTKTPLSRGSTALLVLAFLVVQIGVYHRSFGIKPASDDFPYVNEIVRGNESGTAIFFRQSFTSLSYRPLTSLCIWIAGQASPEHRPFALRVFGFIGLAMYMGVLGLWCRAMRLNRLATIVALAVGGLHPVLPATVGSIDGFNALISTALLWMGAWLMWRLQDRPMLALLLISICFWDGAGFKEYILGLIPLGLGAAVLLPSRPRFRFVAVAGAMLVAFVAILMLIRAHTIPDGAGHGVSYVSLRPIQWVQNAVTITTGLLFFGNSVWVFTHRSTAVLAAVAALALAAGLLLFVGVKRKLVSDPKEVTDDIRRLRLRDPSNLESPATSLHPTLSDSRWLLFLLSSLVLASFPANISVHISEMYLPPVIIPLALIAAIAANGFQYSPAKMRAVAIVAGIAAVVSSLLTIHSKIEGLRDVGERAEIQLRQILAQIPANQINLKVAMVFNLDELPPRRTYSVYLMGDENLVVHEMAFNWLVPERHIQLGSYPVGFPDFTLEQADFAFRWNYPAQRFDPMKVPSTMPVESKRS